VGLTKRRLQQHPPQGLGVQRQKAKDDIRENRRWTEWDSFRDGLGPQGLVSPPHVLISADQNYAYTFSSHFGWKATWQWPTQHHSALISTDQSAQH